MAKIAILGYGNLGRGVECAVKQADAAEARADEIQKQADAAEARADEIQKQADAAETRADEEKARADKYEKMLRDLGKL